ncbi:MAG: translin family protein [Promethearchaeota archaeon]
MNLKKIIADITETLDELDQNREEILKQSRLMIRNCSIAIKSIHRKEMDVYKEKIQEIKNNHEVLLQYINKNRTIFSNYLKTPEQEYVEAVCLYEVITNKDLSNPAELKVDPINYLLGLADVIGEMRRFILDQIRTGLYDNLDGILERMEEIYSFLFSIDYPKGLTRDLRHKTDIARSIIEKTRGDISLSTQINRLNNNLKKI